MTKKSNTLLSICIPTYNRASLLTANVLEIIEQVREFNFPIYIADNCSTDNTTEAVGQLGKQYDQIFYYRHEENIFDLNCPFVLRKSDADYCWLLSDKVRLADGSIKTIVALLDEKYDAIAVNDNLNKVKGLATKLYQNPVLLLEELGWHLTQVGCLIVSKKIINNANYEKYQNTNFMQTAGLFEALTIHDTRVLWYNEPIIKRAHPDTYTNYWLNSVFPVFFDSWASAIMCLPSIYPVSSKLVCIKSHGVKTGLFSIKSFFLYRSLGLFNFRVYIKYRNMFPLFTNVHWLVLFFIANFPALPIRLLKHMKKFISKFMNKQNVK
jgi:glycosyltransferase involved in cell wall biosynthesis